MFKVQTRNRSFYVTLLVSTLLISPGCATFDALFKKPRISSKTKQVKAPSKVAKSSKIKKSSRIAKSPKRVKPKKIPKVRQTGNACNIADPGYGIYYPWVKNLEMGRMLLPKEGALTADNGFDLLIHFHGGNAVRKTMVKSVHGVFVVGIDLGAGSGAYGRPFSRPDVFVKLLDDIESAVAEYTGNPRAHIRKLALTGWSAGYGAVRAILRQKASRRVNAVVLLDGLHTDYVAGKKLRDNQLSPFVRFARGAAEGQKFMFVSHSSIVPPGYASTTETSHYLTKKLGIGIHKSPAQDSRYLSRYEEASKGSFLMRGYRGEGKSDHCAHLALIADVAEKLEARWETPLAKGRRYTRPKPIDESIKKPSIAKGENLKQIKG